MLATIVKDKNVIPASTNIYSVKNAIDDGKNVFLEHFNGKFEKFSKEIVTIVKKEESYTVVEVRDVNSGVRLGIFIFSVAMLLLLLILYFIEP